MSLDGSSSIWCTSGLPTQVDPAGEQGSRGAGENEGTFSPAPLPAIMQSFLGELLGAIAILLSCILAMCWLTSISELTHLDPPTPLKKGL